MSTRRDKKHDLMVAFHSHLRRAEKERRMKAAGKKPKRKFIFF